MTDVGFHAYVGDRRPQEGDQPVAVFAVAGRDGQGYIGRAVATGQVLVIELGKPGEGVNVTPYGWAEFPIAGLIESTAQAIASLEADELEPGPIYPLPPVDGLDDGR